jgi:HAD superfamily hydrolase (TIGR01509 family)
MAPLPFAVIFDMDGVLVDTVKLNWRAHNEVLAQYGVHVRDDELFQYVGRALGDQLGMINQHYGLTIDLPSFEAAIAPIEDQLHANIKPKPGVVALIERLVEQKIPIAVGTSSPREVTLKRLRMAGLVQFFDVIVTRNEVERHKPDPSVYLYAARQLGRDPKRCIVIEDAPSGLLAAHNAGMKCCAVEVPYVPSKLMRAAELHIPSLDQLNVKELEALL